MALLLRWRLAKAAVSTISPQVGTKWGEMSGRTEGGRCPASIKKVPHRRSQPKKPPTCQSHPCRRLKIPRDLLADP
ncbi:MAG: hypothetical protein EOR92_10145 [Mesorhizobium sp.]|nr:MAG: hypothetical protein EOR92_10145 [Mesorhizobium sp.]